MYMCMCLFVCCICFGVVRACVCARACLYASVRACVCVMFECGACVCMYVDWNTD